MATRVNGGVFSGESLTGNMNFFTIHTVIALEEGNFGATNSAKRNLIRLMETVALGAQPVIVSVSQETVDLTVAGNRTIYGLGADFNQAATVINTVKFAVEHAGRLGDATTALDVTTKGSLANLLDGVPMPFETAAVPAQGGAVDISVGKVAAGGDKNITVKFFETL